MNDFHPVVVVAEDDALVRLLATDALLDAGFEVAEAGSGEEALAILQSRGAAVAVLFTDVQMPGAVNGLQLARQVHDQWPAVGVLVASSWSNMGAAELPPGSRFVAKPYRLGHVVEHVQELAAA
jgi:CheY-like chemotaxis protein